MSELEKYLDDGWASQDSETTETEVSQSETEAETESVDQTTQETETKSEDSNIGDLEKKLNELDVSKPEEKEQASDILEKLGSLGVIRNGVPVEFESEEQVKELLSKGFDYTQKTQEFADFKKDEETKINEERESFQKQVDEFKEQETKMHDDLVSHQVLFNVLKRLEKEDPEAVSTIESMYDQELSLRNATRNDPFVNELKQEIGTLKEKLEGRDQQSVEKENQTILKEWDDGLSGVQKEWGTKVKSLGVKPSWNKVQDVWKNDTSGSMTVKQAFLAVHGDDIARALESKSKLLETKAKSNLRNHGDEIEQADTVDKPKGTKSYLDAAFESAKKLGIGI